MGPAGHEKVAIYVVNQRISNVSRIVGATQLRNNPWHQNTYEKEHPIIQLTVGFASDFISIQMINSKDPAEIFDHKTTKKDVYAHGFGLSIIQETCNKNDGSCQWEDKGDTFESNVLLRYQG